MTHPILLLRNLGTKEGNSWGAPGSCGVITLHPMNLTKFL